MVRTEESRLSEGTINTIKRGLIEERSELAARLEDQKRSKSVVSNPDRSDLAQAYDQHQRQLALREKAEKHLKAIDEALGRLETGTYGRCADCGKAISLARLEALPFAELCISCQGQRDERAF